MLRRRRTWTPQGDDAAHGPFPDKVGRGADWATPLVVDRCRVASVEPCPADTTTPAGEPAPADWHRVTFQLRVRDATGRRLPDVAVDVTVTAPHRTTSGLGATDLAGQTRFRIDGPPGTYALVVDAIAGHAFDLDDASVLDAAVTVASTEPRRC